MSDDKRAIPLKGDKPLRFVDGDQVTVEGRGAGVVINHTVDFVQVRFPGSKVLVGVPDEEEAYPQWSKLLKEKTP